MRTFFGFSDDRQLRDYGIMCLCIFAMCSALGLTYPLLSVILEKRGISSAVIGLNAGMIPLAFLLVSPLAGRLANRYNPKKLLYAALAISALCIVLFKVFDQLWVWFFLRFIMGSAEALVFVISEIWLTGSAPDRARGRLISLYGTSLAAGFLIGSSALYVTGFEGWPPFVCGALLLTATVLPLTQISKLSLPQSHAKPPSVFSMLRIYPLALWGAFAFGAIELGTYALIVNYGLHLGFSEQMATGYLLALIAGNIVLQFPLGLIADKVSKQHLLLAMAVIGTACCAVLPGIVLQPWLTIPVMFVLGGLIISVYTVSLSVIGEQAKGGALISANAAMNAIYGLGAFISPAIVGTAMHIHDPHGYAYAITALFALYTAYLAKQVISSAAQPAPTPPSSSAPSPAQHND